jgi:diphthamide synthase (EF-2-diphthine--ammonia ligase)
MLCVPKLSTMSPRFVYYADNWRVIHKIQRFTETGEFESTVKDCPAFGADELRAALDYLDRPETAKIIRESTPKKTLHQAERRRAA